MFDGDTENAAIQSHGVRGQTNYEQSSKETPNNVHDVKTERAVSNQALKKKRHGNLETQYDETLNYKTTHWKGKTGYKYCNPLPEADKEVLRLQGKVLRLQEKIAKLQHKVAELQGLNIWLPVYVFSVYDEDGLRYENNTLKLRKSFTSGSRFHKWRDEQWKTKGTFSKKWKNISIVPIGNSFQKNTQSENI